ncbi:MAG: tetratricopeptide repeat protein, partial [Bacteroidia bacterium]|nr:tetratricopeptide repeat protein [Bacteroidia bacterium]
MKRLIYIALLLFKGVLAFNQTTTVDSLLTVLKTAKEDTNKVNTLIQLSEKAGWRVGNYDTALYYAQNAHTLAEKLGFKKGIASSYNNIGIVYYYQDDFASAMEYHLKSLKIREELGLKSNMAGSYANIGMVYYEQGDYARAMEYYLKALKIYEELGMKSNMAISYNNIGGIYYDQVDYSSAMEYYLKALKIREELGIKSDMTYSYNNIGNVYYDQGDYVRAMEYQLKALKIYEDMGMKSSMAVSYNNIGAIYSAQGDDASAMEYFFKALKIRKELGLKSGLAISYISIGTIYYDQRHIVLALQYVAKGLALAEETGHVMWIRDASDLLYNIHKKQGNYKEALKMHELYILMRDSMQNEETYKATMQQAFRYEQEKKAVADSIKAAEAEKVHLANLEVEKTKTAAQKRQNIFLYVGLGLVALFGLFMFNRFRVTQKQKIIIEEKEKETSLQKHVIEEKHKEITDSINYAERIQRSFLATKEILDKNLGEYFVFFKPKDVVSGDFYWAASILSSSAVENHLSVSTPLDVTPPSPSSNATTKPVSSSEVENNSSSSAVENFILATADSTGHGVPGAIMSLLNITSLEKAIETETEPHHILNKTRQIII